MHLGCALLIVVHFFGAVCFLCPVGLWCCVCVLVITFGLFSQWNWLVRGGRGTWFVLWCFSRPVVALFGVVCPGFLLRGLIRPLFGRPKVSNPNNLQHNLSSTESHMTQPFTPHRLPQFTRRCKHRQTRTLNQLRHKWSETQRSPKSGKYTATPKSSTNNPLNNPQNKLKATTTHQQTQTTQYSTNRQTSKPVTHPKPFNNTLKCTRATSKQRTITPEQPKLRNGLELPAPPQQAAPERLRTPKRQTHP